MRASSAQMLQPDRGERNEPLAGHFLVMSFVWACLSDAFALFPPPSLSVISMFWYATCSAQFKLAEHILLVLLGEENETESNGRET
jgi:hypothetical protein